MQQNSRNEGAPAGARPALCSSLPLPLSLTLARGIVVGIIKPFYDMQSKGKAKAKQEVNL